MEPCFDHDPTFSQPCSKHALCPNHTPTMAQPCPNHALCPNHTPTLPKPCPKLFTFLPQPYPNHASVDYQIAVIDINTREFLSEVK